MDFTLYEPEDFASNESYLRFYFRLNDADILFWQSWISNHPEKLDSIINADQLINLLALQLDENEVATEHQRLMAAINIDLPADISTDEHSRDTQVRHSRFRRLLSAAALVITCTCIILIIQPVKKPSSPALLKPLAGQQLRHKANGSNKAEKVYLEDGSTITLQPGSAIEYPDQFLPERREVKLEGEAFFEVSKNSRRPFYVYCGNLVTHVLGTSFNINPNKTNGKIEVEVKSGKVEVYEQVGEQINREHQGNGLILTPNQKAVYITENNRFESALVDIPLPINRAETKPVDDSMKTLLLPSTPQRIREILEVLEEEYGIEIEVENDDINNCHVSGQLIDMNLYHRLDAICQSLNVTYEIKGTKILIRGKGCN